MSQETATRERPRRDRTGKRDAAATLRRLRATAVIATLVLILLLDAVRQALHPYLLSWAGRLVMGGAIFLGAVALLGGMFNVVERLYRSLELRNRELLALHEEEVHLHQRLSSLAVTEERLRIAREMHDGLAQVLAYVNTKAQAVNEYLRGGRTQEAARQLDQLASAARDVYADVRASILGLRTAPGPDRSLAVALADLGEVWQEQSGIPCELHVQGEIRLPPGSELQLMRIVQEALANVRKHAHAHRAEVTFERGAGGVVMVSVTDDGIGFNLDALRPGRFPRFGLATMRERAESIGGSMRFEAPEAGGTRVVVELPFEG